MATLYAHITGTTIQQVGALPRLWHDGTRWWDLRPVDLQPAFLASLGWRPVVQVTRPADTDTHTNDWGVTLVAGVPTQTWTPRPWTAQENAARAHTAALNQVRNNIVTQAIAWLETDAAEATSRAAAINTAVTTATTRRTQVQGFTFNGSNVTNINAQLNNSLKPILVDMLTYIIGLGNLAQGTEEWRGTKADPALVWLARHATDTTDP